MDYCTSRMWTFSTAHHFCTLSRTCQNLMLKQAFGQAGLKKQEGLCRTVSPMIDSDKFANKSMHGKQQAKKVLLESAEYRNTLENMGECCYEVDLAEGQGIIVRP